MRIHRFRAIDKKTKQVMFDGQLATIRHIGGKLNFTTWDWLEYTGRKYEGIDVAEGDIIKSDEPETNPLEVFWDQELDGFAARSLDKEHLYQTPLPVDGYKIIGNIYENPELFKQ